MVVVGGWTLEFYLPSADTKRFILTLQSMSRVTWLLTKLSPSIKGCGRAETGQEREKTAGGGEEGAEGTGEEGTGSQKEIQSKLPHQKKSLFVSSLKKK